MIGVRIKDGSIPPSDKEGLDGEQLDWFELRNGGYIGICSFGLVYGLRDERAYDSIDDRIRHESTIRIANYPDGFDVQFNTHAGWARIQKNKYRFSTPAIAEDFKSRMLETFPKSVQGEKTKNRLFVVREPLIALIILLILFLAIMTLDPARDRAASSFGAFLLTLSAIPDPFVIAAYTALSGLALFYVWHLQNEHKHTDFKLILSND